MNTLPKFKQVTESIKSYISANNLKPGSRIASERQLAKEIRVSTVTVSRGIQELVKQGILERHVGKGTFVASPNKKGTGRIALFSRYKLLDDYIHGIECGIKTFLKDKDCELLALENKNIDFCEAVKNFSIEGAIFVSPLEENIESIKSLHQTGMPVAIVGYKYDYFKKQTFCNNDYESGIEAVNYFVALGHKRIAIVNKSKSPSNNERLTGFQKGMFLNNCPLDPSWIIEAQNPQLDSIHNPDVQAIINMLKSPTAPTAIFATSPGLLLQSYTAVNHLKLKIPDDISVLGFDELPSGIYVSPLPTLFRQPLQEIGESAAEFVYRKMNSLEQKTYNSFCAKIIERESCKERNI
jgi:DNA-binding LacI/PurR family transcriptional regulator